METLQQEIARYRDRYNRARTAVGLVAAYALLVLLPLLSAWLVHPATGDAFATGLGKNFALLALPLLVLQPVLASRFPEISHYYGLDLVLRFHKSMAVLALLFLLCHPLLIAAGTGKWRLLYGFALPWPIWLGKIGLLLLVVQAVTSHWQRRLLAFERWRRLHNQAVLILALVLTHSWQAGADLKHPLLRVLWILLAILAAAAYGYHKLYKPRLGLRHAYHVKEVRPETHNVRTIVLEPPAGEKPFLYLPGQFHFLTFYRGDRRTDGEEHHFTISSSPTQPGILTSTIKASGDFTQTLGEMPSGTKVRVEGPFGRFSRLLYPGPRNPVFIAGGIGITPIMSMLRYMRDTGSELKVILLYANKTEKDIVFRDELTAMTAKLRLRVVHVLSHPRRDWKGEYGRIDQEMIRRYCGIDLQGLDFYLCCPPAMMRTMHRALKDLRVAPRQIYSERFWL